MKPRARVTAAVMLIALSAPAKVLACATCFGASGSGQVEGMNGAIIGLLIFALGMMAAFGSFFLYLKKRARIHDTGHTPPDRTANQEEIP